MEVVKFISWMNELNENEKPSGWRSKRSIHSVIQMPRHQPPIRVCCSHLESSVFDATFLPPCEQQTVRAENDELPC